MENEIVELEKTIERLTDAVVDLCAAHERLLKRVNSLENSTKEASSTLGKGQISSGSITVSVTPPIYHDV